MTLNPADQNPVRRLFSDYKYYWIAFYVVLIDQLVKLIVKFNMNPYDEIKVAGDFFSINFIENEGAAFGLTIADILRKVGIEMSDTTAKLTLTLFSIFAVIIIIYLLRQVRHYRSPLPFFLALILGGAVGNIIDRVFYGVWFAGMNDYEGGLLHGRVVDMFYMNWYHGDALGFEMNLWPVFNIADAAISIGIVAIILFQRRFFRLHQQRVEQENLPDPPGEDIPERQVADNSATEIQPPDPENSVEA